MPVFSILYFIFILSNFGFPGTFNFVGEFLILVGGFEFSNVVIFISTFGMVLSLIYTLFLYNRIFFGALQTNFIRYYCDCSRLEFYLLSILIICILIGGLHPTVFFCYFKNLLLSDQLIMLQLMVISTTSLKCVIRRKDGFISGGLLMICRVFPALGINL